MTISSRIYAELSQDSYNKDRLAGIRPIGKEEVLVDGVAFEVREHYDNPETGYQGAIYQRADTKKSWLPTAVPSSILRQNRMSWLPMGTWCCPASMHRSRRCCHGGAQQRDIKV